MSPEEILRDAEDMAKHYPGDRLRLTGVEVLALVIHVQRPLIIALQKATGEYSATWEQAEAARDEAIARWLKQGARTEGDAALLPTPKRRKKAKR